MLVEMQVATCFVIDREDSVDGGGLGDALGGDGEGLEVERAAERRLLRYCTPITLPRLPRRRCLIAGVEEGSQCGVEAVSHVVGDLTGVVEGFGGGFRLEGVVVL